MSDCGAAGRNLQVCLFDMPPMRDFHGYDLHTFNPGEYISPRERSPLKTTLLYGLKGARRFENLYSAAGVDRLYLSRDPAYMRMVSDFVERFRGFDLVIMLNYNPIHPEVLYHELKRPIKILGLVDDPQASYSRTVPYLWAFDGAVHISPSYDEFHLFSEKLAEWGVSRHRWWPLRQEPEPELSHDPRFFEGRDIDLVYVGKAYGPKVDRLKTLKRKFGSRFRIYGRWPVKGYFGYVRWLAGKPALFHRVRPLTIAQRRDLYFRTRIGFNMHLSEIPRETGNMRMYEVPAHGALLICDKAGRDAHEHIFSPGEEAVFYDSIDDAIDKIDYYLADEAERIRIARNGYRRLHCDYAWNQNLKGLLDWAMAVRHEVHHAAQIGGSRP